MTDLLEAGIEKVEVVESPAFPVFLKFEGSFSRMNLTIAEARELAYTLIRMANEAEDNATRYVRVQFASSLREYTYIDPSGTLREGDMVVVPAGNTEKVVEVIGIGRGVFEGECKPVLGKAEIL